VSSSTDVTTIILLGIYWLVMVLALGGSLAFAILAWRVPRRLFVGCSAGLLAIAIILSSIPAVPAPVVVAIVLTVLALGVGVIGGGPAAVVVLRLATRESVTDGEHGGILAKDGSEVLRGGTMIGLLERLAVAGSIIAGFPEAVAVVVAIKGVGRFTELEAAPIRERFIIGTLVSFVWAAAAAAVVLLARS
jgi:hypothetical protein